MIHFESLSQLVFTVIFAVMAVVCFFCGFYNPFHFGTSMACIVMVFTVYKHWWIMGKEIIRQLPDGECDYDGDEEDGSEYQEMIDT